MSNATPMMQQWHQCKEKAKESLLLFRLGDFYEAFYDDAKALAKELELTLTKRHGIPMAGVPVHAVEGYLEKLIHRGHKVAIAEQIEKASAEKGLVKRDIVRTISPATYIDKPILQDTSNHFFACIIQINATFGLALSDLSTGELSVLEIDNIQSLIDELTKRHPKEILTSKKFHKQHAELLDHLKLEFGYRLNIKEDWSFDFQISYEWLRSHFQVQTLDGFGVKHMTAGINAAGGLLAYINEDLSLSISHVHKLSPVQLDKYMAIDHATIKHLEVLSANTATEGHSLLKLLNRSYTPMGHRMMKVWVSHPLLEVSQITKRQDCIEHLLSNNTTSETLVQHLGEVRDLERLIMRIVSGYAGPRDLYALGISLKQLPGIIELLQSIPVDFIHELLPQLSDLDAIQNKIESAIEDSPPLKLTEGGIFKEGYNEQLDELKQLKENSKEWLAKYQEELRETLGIKTLKVNFNKAFGYYIEVSRIQSKLMPASFHKRQTLVNNERYISEELKAFEEKIYHAEENLSCLEYELFHALRQEIAAYEVPIRKVAEAIANIDCILALSIVAKERLYVRPLVDNSAELAIKNGKHPILDATITQETFIPNDTDLNADEKRIMLITGPNMAGKSTYIRQVALLTILAQIGSFLPAEEAHIGIVDKLFSRIGANDDLSRGQSTFMVEMTETANILNNATQRSLIILDEIGRGTSTYDGVAIAWSVVQYLLEQEGKKAKTLFATHYHELTELENKFHGIKNYRSCVDESGDTITFLRKIIPGGSDRSYGIYVAQLAGMPHQVVETAKEQLALLQSKPKKEKNTKARVEDNSQFLLFPNLKSNKDEEIKVLGQIKSQDILSISPLDAFALIQKWQKMLKS